MKKIHISSDRILLILMVLQLWYTTLVKACESDANLDLEPKVSEISTKKEMPLH